MSEMDNFAHSSPMEEDFFDLNDFQAQELQIHDSGVSPNLIQIGTPTSENDHPMKQKEMVDVLIGNDIVVKSEQKEKEQRKGVGQTVEIAANVQKRIEERKAREMLNVWFFGHLDNPYPTFQQKEELAEKCNLSMSQISCWFCNKRGRLKNKLFRKNKTHK